MGEYGRQIDCAFLVNGKGIATIYLSQFLQEPRKPATPGTANRLKNILSPYKPLQATFGTQTGKDTTPAPKTAQKSILRPSNKNKNNIFLSVPPCGISFLYFLLFFILIVSRRKYEKSTVQIRENHSHYTRKAQSAQRKTKCIDNFSQFVYDRVERRGQYVIVCGNANRKRNSHTI